LGPCEINRGPQVLALDGLQRLQPDVAVGLVQQLAGRSYQWLNRALKRLVVATIDIQTARYQAVFSLLGGYKRDEATGEYWISISPEAKKAFDRADTTHIDWELRAQINRRLPLAKWLEDYVRGHARGQRHTIGVDKLYREANIEGRFRNFKSRDLPRTLKELERVRIIEKAEIRRDGMVTWWRPAAGNHR